MGISERDALLAMVLTPGFGPTIIARALERFGSAAEAVGATGVQLAQLERVGRRTADELRRGLDEVERTGAVRRELEEVERAGVRIVARGEADYPRLLTLIPDPPPLLWVRGEVREDDGLALAIVGARKCTAYGREQADRFAAACSQAGLCIVSGGAYGIDIAAHRAVLRVGGRTIAVLGNGLSNPYPQDHRGVFDEIVARDLGAVVSELPMNTPPIAENFPRRNRIISGLSLGVLVIEAARRSGSLITARQCVEEHGREAMAVPGRVDSPLSEGCHRMVQEGWGRLVTNAADVLDSLGDAGRILKDAVTQVEQNGDVAKPQADLFDATFTDAQRKIVEALSEPRSLDDLVSATALPVHVLQADLTMLELRGALRRERGLFARNARRRG